jgi:hypothetical protein
MPARFLPGQCLLAARPAHSGSQPQLPARPAPGSWSMCTAAPGPDPTVHRRSPGQRRRRPPAGARCARTHNARAPANAALTAHPSTRPRKPRQPSRCERTARLEKARLGACPAGFEPPTVLPAAGFHHAQDCSRLLLRCVRYARPRRTLSHCPGRRRAREAAGASLGCAMKITTDDSVPERQAPGLTSFTQAHGPVIAPGRSAPVPPLGTGLAIGLLPSSTPCARVVR